MKKVLVATEKYYIRVFDATTEELELKALRKLFREREQLGVYMDWSRLESALLLRAKSGDLAALRRVFKLRHSYEYERVDWMDVENGK